MGRIFCGGLKNTLICWSHWHTFCGHSHYVRFIWHKVVKGIHQSEASLILLDNNDTPTGHSPYNVYYSHAFVLRWTWIVLLVQFTGYNDWILNPRSNETHTLIFRIMHWNPPSRSLLFHTLSESTVRIWFLD